MTADSSKQQLQNTGRGGLALSLAKAYFVGLGLVQQVVLSWLLGDAYGALRGALSPASITYNAAVSASVFGMSRAVSHASPEQTGAVIRRGLALHALLGLALGLGFWLFAAPIGAALHSEYLVPHFRWLSVVVGAYAVYAAFVGVLNGQRRFLAQAALDMIAATLRTVALVAGGYLAVRTSVVSAVSGALTGFAAMSLVMMLLAAGVVGLGRTGATGYSSRHHLGFVLQVMGAQFLLNLLLQADTNTLRAAATRAAEDAGLAVTSADLLVGAYNAGQLFAFLPYQLLTALTFLLFPLLAKAQADADVDAVRHVVNHGCRVAVIVVGLLVSVTAALPGGLLRLVFPPQFAEIGTESMRVLCVGMGGLALFGVFGAVLNGLGKQSLGLAITAAGLGCVSLANWLFVRNAGFGPQLLSRTALSTSLAVVLVAVVSGFAVMRLTGGGLGIKALLRVAVATAVCVALGTWLGSPGKVLTLVWSAVCAALYVALLVLGRELTSDDWRAVKALSPARRAR